MIHMVAWFDCKNGLVCGSCISAGHAQQAED